MRVCVWMCGTRPGGSGCVTCVRACVDARACVCERPGVCEWMSGCVCECVPVGACSDLGVHAQLLHHRVRHEGEKGGNDCCVDLCLICCVLSRLSTGMHAADLQNLLIVLPIYPVILVSSTIRVLL